MDSPTFARLQYSQNKVKVPCLFPQRCVFPHSVSLQCYWALLTHHDDPILASRDADSRRRKQEQRKVKSRLAISKSERRGGYHRKRRARDMQPGSMMNGRLQDDRGSRKCQHFQTCVTKWAKSGAGPGDGRDDAPDSTAHDITSRHASGRCDTKQTPLRRPASDSWVGWVADGRDIPPCVSLSL